MVHGVALEGTSVILAFGRPTLAERRFVAANDNGPRDPVKTVTVRRMLEQSGVAIKVKVPVTEFIGVAVATSISEDGVLTSSIERLRRESQRIANAQQAQYQVYERAPKSLLKALDDYDFRGVDRARRASHPKGSSPKAK